MTRYLIRNIKLVALLFFIALLTGNVLLGSPQQEISGIINTYAKVNTIEAADAVILDDVSGFNNGDTVLFIQMKGVSIQISHSTGFGNVDNYYGSPGFYEFIIIEQVEGSPANRITFRNNLVGFGAYDATGYIQLIKVPSYQGALVTDELTCPPWDSISGTGGVLALIVDSKLELNADINVSGKGFLGGSVSTMDGNPLNDTFFYYPESSSVAGRKGESLASHAAGSEIFIDTLAKGIGAMYNGGGGATGEFSGGGGGASFGSGGSGGYQGTTGFSIRGIAGRKVETIDFSDRVIMGGGGGGSGSNGGTGSGGASGGGIVFILADTLIGNNHAIKANGDSVQVVASGNGGAGGGGAAGSLVLSIDTYASSNVTLEARGGAGGYTNETFGTGGGGGGGLVWLRSPLIDPELDIDISGGAAGKINYPAGTSSASAGPGTEGIIRNDLNLLLNGFLYNSIISSATKTKTDSICFGQIPGMLTGTEPVGGIEPYTFRWERKTDEETSWSLVPGSGSTKDLIITSAETDTVQFRRVVTDSNASPLSDTSKPVTIIVQALIINNIVGYDTIICYGQDPQLLVPQSGLPGGGNSIYSYLWLDSTEVQGWQSAPGSLTNPDYDPPVLTTSTYYSRIVTSGMCVDTSNIVEVEVLPLITNNTIASDQLICHDELFDDLSGSDPADGDGSYTYEWISSTDQFNWVQAEGVIDARDYDPDENSPDFPGDKYYRRVVRSGYLGCCVDTSSQVQLSSLPAIGNNTVSADQTICRDSVPAPLLGSVPDGGDGNNYSFIWEDSTRAGSWMLIPGADQSDYNPPALADTTWYRRIIISSACDDTSNVVVINVHPSITNNTVSTISGLADTTICSGQVPNTLEGEAPGGGDGSYFFEWEYSTDQLSWNPAPGTNDQAEYQPPALTEDTWYRRIVLSGECAVASNPVSIVVLPLIADNAISSDQMVCYNTLPGIITGSSPAGGDGNYTYLWEQSTDNITWVAAPGNNTSIDYQSPEITEETFYRRTVFSGLSDCCQDVSNVVTLGINPLPEGIITYALDTTCAGTDIDISLSLTGAAPWTVVLNDGTADLPAFEADAASYDFTHSPTYSSDYTFSSITDNNSCVATDMTGFRSVVVYAVPDANAGPDDEVCGPEYSLNADPSVGDGIWLDFSASLDDISDPVSPTATIRVNSYGTHTYWWKETNWECTDSASVDIVFWEEPDPAYAGEDQELVAYQFESELEAGAPSVGTGTWSVVQSSGDPQNPYFVDPNDYVTGVRDLSYGDNILMWTIENGECITSDQVVLSVPMVFIPGGYSPNGDTFNQTFMIEGIEHTTNELIVTNITGAVVFRKTNYQNDWEGTNLDGNPLPEGTYYYFLTIKTPVSERLSGYIVIKR
ncbi:MAG: gliding motility-associated C-terminal domain-containing protein [Bacteroidales bacterium]|jgi:gliding motility-associated-like protein|nr:gliding motility-associated C-terminal domain-containing protein [Bacteroidales bacterium]